MSGAGTDSAPGSGDGDGSGSGDARVLFAGTVPDTAAMEALGAAVGPLLVAGDLLVLTGPLGAGKTTFTRGLGESMGVRGQVASPTFVLARTHPREGGAPLVHVDAYRLGGEAELDDLDLDFAGSVVVVEWGAGLLDDVAESWLDVVVERRRGGEGGDVAGEPLADDDRTADDVDEPRTVTVTAHGPRWAGTRLPGGPAAG